MRENVLESGKQLDRLIFFSDAVFAIAITLLVLDIRLPDGLPEERIGEELFALWPQFLGYFLSFWVIGIYWRAHHRVFGHVERLDGTLILLNLVFLMSVAFMPFPTSVVGEYGNTQVGVVVYAVSLMVMVLLMNSISLYTYYNDRLVEPGLDRRLIRRGLARGFSVSVICLVVIALSFFVPQYALLAFFLMTVVPRFIIRIMERKSPDPQ